MTRREKLLATGFGVTLAGLTLVVLVRWAVLEPFAAVQREIEAEQKRGARLAEDLAALSRVEKDWQGLGSRTFATDPMEAGRLFRADLQELLERHRLRVDRVSPGSPRPFKDVFRAVGLQVSASGTLNQVVGFLCDFYRRDYLARLEKVRVNADASVMLNYNTASLAARTKAPSSPPAGQRSGRRAEAARQRLTTTGLEIGPDGPELRVNFTAVTLVLPKLKDLDQPVMEAVVELESGRLGRKLDEYDLIFERNPFLPYREKAIVQPPPPTSEPAPQLATPEPPPAPTPPPPDPRGGADQQFVRGTTRLNGELIAYVVDERQTEHPVTSYHLDEPIDDGVVLLILPQGLVVRAERPGGIEEDYFYPLGKSFAEREAVTEDEHPDVVATIREAFFP